MRLLCIGNGVGESVRGEGDAKPHIEVQTSAGNVLVDRQDVRFVMRKVNVNENGYATISWKGKTKSLARVIMGFPSGMVVDHINHNRLDNRRANLRVCTSQQNACNNSGRKNKRHTKYKGVYYLEKAPNCKWLAYTRCKGKRINFGQFRTEQEAAIAYNVGAQSLFGEFACLNDVSHTPVGTSEPVEAVR